MAAWHWERAPSIVRHAAIDYAVEDLHNRGIEFGEENREGPMMKTETISFEISQDLLASLKLGSAALGQSIRLLAAIAYFQDKKLSLGKAAQLAGLNRLHFMDVLARKGIVIFDYDESMLATELDGIAQLRPDSRDHQ